MRSDLRRVTARAGVIAAVALLMSAHAEARGVEAGGDSLSSPPPGSTVELRSQAAIPTVGWKTADQVPVWKTMTLGAAGSVNMLREALDSSTCAPGGHKVAAGATVVRAAVLPQTTTPNCRLGESAAEIMGRPGFHLSHYRQEIDLVVISAADLGFAADDDVTLEAVQDRAEMLGFALCPAEIGPLLRLGYLDQPTGEFLHIAMQPIATYSGALTSFAIGNDSAGLLLIGSDGRPEMAMLAVTRFVFVKPRPRLDR